MALTGEIVQLKVRLLGISPMIWRRLLVPASMTLQELHGVLQVAMGWEGIHLFSFDIHAVGYGSFELSLADPRVALGSFDLRKNDKVSYVYDMGDHWEHEIRVEEFGKSAPKKSYPICIGGSGTCPPEDCGGPHGFLERRDEADGYDAWQDMGLMVEWLDDVMQPANPHQTVRDVLTDDIEAAMHRVIAREPYQTGKFSRKLVNEAFRAERHRELMHQQLA